VDVDGWELVPGGSSSIRFKSSYTVCNLTMNQYKEKLPKWPLVINLFLCSCVTVLVQVVLADRPQNDHSTASISHVDSVWALLSGRKLFVAVV
jgi:hypothetical protein